MTFGLCNICKKLVTRALECPFARASCFNPSTKEAKDPPHGAAKIGEAKIRSAIKLLRKIFMSHPHLNRVYAISEQSHCENDTNTYAPRFPYHMGYSVNVMGIEPLFSPALTTDISVACRDTNAAQTARYLEYMQAPLLASQRLVNGAVQHLL